MQDLHTAKWYLNDRYTYLGGRGRIWIANTFPVFKFSGFQCRPVLVPTRQPPSEISRQSALIERIGRAATAALWHINRPTWPLHTYGADNTMANMAIFAHLWCRQPSTSGTEDTTADIVPAHLWCREHNSSNTQYTRIVYTSTGV